MSDDRSGTPTMPQARLCPICGKPATPTHDPFCSGRCADVDLNRWLGGVYAVPSEEGDPLTRSNEDEA